MAPTFPWSHKQGRKVRPDGTTGAVRAGRRRRDVAREAAREVARGVTLIEVLTSVTVLGLIMGPLTSSAVFYVDHGREASAHFADDSTVRAVTALFVADGQSADSVVVPDAAPCAGNGAAALATISWDDDGVVFRASWFADASEAVTSLVRRRCTGTSLVSTIVIGDIAAPPVVSCAPTCGAPTSLTISGTTADGSTFAVTAQRRSS